MRVASTFVLAFFGALASVNASADTPDVDSVGVLPAFIQYQNMYANGDHSADTVKQLKSLGAKLDEQDVDLTKVIGTSSDSMDLIDMIDSFISLKSAGMSEEDQDSIIKSRASKEDDEEDCEDEEMAAPGKVEQFIALNKKLSTKDADKASDYKSDLKKFNKLGKQLKADGTQIKHVVGTGKFGKAAAKMVEDTKEDVSIEGLLKIVKDSVSDEASTNKERECDDENEKRDSTLAAPGKVEQFIALNQKLRESDASKSSTYNADVKKFQTLGKQLKAEGLQYKKVLGSSEFAQAAVKLMEDLSDDVATLGDMLKELVGDILKRDTSEIAAPGKVEQFIALNQKLTQPDASKSSTYGADVKQFQSLGKQLKKEGLSTDKALGSSAFAVAAKKMIKDVSDDVKEVGSMLTEALGDVVKRDGLADLIGDIIPTEENLKKLSNALTNPEAVSSPHYQKTLENLKKVGLKMKKDGKDVKSLVGTGEQAEALAEMFNQAGDKQTDVRDHSIPILSGRNLHGDAHSHASMARRRAHSHGLEN